MLCFRLNVPPKGLLINQNYDCVNFKLIKTHKIPKPYTRIFRSKCHYKTSRSIKYLRPEARHHNLCQLSFRLCQLPDWWRNDFKWFNFKKHFDCITPFAAWLKLARMRPYFFISFEKNAAVSAGLLKFGCFESGLRLVVGVVLLGVSRLFSWLSSLFLSVSSFFLGVYNIYIVLSPFLHSCNNYA